MILYLDPPGLMEQHMFGAVTITIAVSAAGVYFFPDHPSVHVKNTVSGQNLHIKVINISPMLLERADVHHQPLPPIVVVIATPLLLPLIPHTLIHCIDPCVKNRGRIFF